MRSGTFESGFSDFHKVVTTTLRKTMPKGYLKTIIYRDNKVSDQSKFNKGLNFKIKKPNSTVQDVFLSVLNTLAPIKRKYIAISTILSLVSHRSKLKIKYAPPPAPNNLQRCKFLNGDKFLKKRILSFWLML